MARKSPHTIVMQQVLITAALAIGLIALAIGGIYFMAKRSPSAPAVERVPTEAITICQKALRGLAKYPATVKFEWRLPETRIDGGQYYVWEQFTAKNSFGVEVSMRGMCIFPPNRSLGAPEVSMSESGL
jgi:hypothetical protein